MSTLAFDFLRRLANPRALAFSTHTASPAGLLQNQQNRKLVAWVLAALLATRLLIFVAHRAIRAAASVQRFDVLARGQLAIPRTFAFSTRAARLPSARHPAEPTTRSVNIRAGNSTFAPVCNLASLEAFGFSARAARSSLARQSAEPIVSAATICRAPRTPRVNICSPSRNLRLRFFAANLKFAFARQLARSVTFAFSARAAGSQLVQSSTELKARPADVPGAPRSPRVNTFRASRNVRLRFSAANLKFASARQLASRLRFPPSTRDAAPSSASCCPRFLNSVCIRSPNTFA